MLVGRFAELLAAVLQRALGKQVDDLTAAVSYPVDALVAVGEAQHLDTLQTVNLLGVAADHADGILLAVADTCRASLDAVHIKVVKQHAGYHQLLMR